MCASKLEGGPAFPVDLAASCRGLRQRVQHGLFGHRLQVGPLPDRSLSESAAEIASQPVLVRQEPRLHELHHQERLIVVCLMRLVPTVPCQQVLPRRVPMPRLHRAFAVHKQQRKGVGRVTSNRGCKHVVCLLPSPTAHDFHPTAHVGCLKERLPAFAEANLKRIPAAATFDVERRGHHLLPPSSPDVHRSPRR